MRHHILYYVGGGGDRSPHGQWFGWYPKDFRKAWSNFVVCKTKAHALRQYLRLSTRYRQLDVRERGWKPYVWKARRDK